MTCRRGEARCWRVLLPVALALGLVAGVRAEDVSERAMVASSLGRLRGASGLRVIPGGLLSLGGGKLRYMAKGASGWRTVHEVPRDNLYRVDADERGRLLAAWEQEPSFHLFDLRHGTHRALAKPPAPPGYQVPFSLDGLYFTEGGQAAIVFVAGHPWAYDTGTRSVLAAYRVRLDGETAPELLFSEEGFRLHTSARGAALVKPAHWRNGCSHSGCPVDAIVAFELGQGRAVRRTIFDGGGQRVDTAQIVRGRYDERFAVQLGSFSEGKRHRRLLRFTYGKEPTLQEFSDWHEADFEHALLARNGDYVEARQASDRTVTVTRLSPAGEESSVAIPPWADRQGRPAKDWFNSLGERKGGGLWLHWGDNLVVGDLAAPRKLDVGEHVKRGTEWAKAYIYHDEPESLWMGIEVGGGRDYVDIDLAEVDRRARPWQPPTAKPGERGPMPPSVASRLSGGRRETVLGRGVVSIGEKDLYYREHAKEDWRLLYAVPDRNIYRLQVDERRGRILAHWSSERIVHLFEPGQGVHRSFAWPTSDLEGLNSGLTNLFFSTDDGYALVYMGGLVRGSGPWINEAYRIPLDGQEAPRRLFRARGNYFDLSPRGATFALPTKESGYRCDTAYCILDSIAVVTIDGEVAKERLAYRQEHYTDYARRVPGKAGDELAVVIRYSLPRDQWQARGRTERALLRFHYGTPGVEKTVLPAWTAEAVRRNHLTESGDYLEFVVTEKHELVIELLGRRDARAAWRLASPRHQGRDSLPDRDVHGFGERSGGGYWLHWGDHIVLLRNGQPPRAFGIARYLKPRAEWAGADGYTASPESLRLGMDIGAGREFIEVSFAAIEKGAAELR
ncbi:MAG TPA: hypothetical protein VFR85_03005 [Anaeromyxobacteraceae bacterium]|nr:hypothetical protein [Anaeromyxobacteraceae bacterium]